MQNTAVGLSAERRMECSVLGSHGASATPLPAPCPKETKSPASQRSKQTSAQVVVCCEAGQPWKKEGSDEDEDPVSPPTTRRWTTSPAPWPRTSETFSLSKARYSCPCSSMPTPSTLFGSSLPTIMRTSRSRSSSSLGGWIGEPCNVVHVDTIQEKDKDLDLLADRTSSPPSHKRSASARTSCARRGRSAYSSTHLRRIQAEGYFRRKD